MKNIIILLLVGAVLFSVACDPIEKREELGTKLSPGQIDATVTATTSGGNQLILKNNTPGVSGTWDYGIGKSFNQEETIVFPLLGKHTFFFLQQPLVVLFKNLLT